MSPFERTWLSVSVVLTLCFVLLTNLKNNFDIVEIVILAIVILMIIAIDSPEIPYVSALVAWVGGLLTGFICGYMPMLVSVYFDSTIIQSTLGGVFFLASLYLAVLTGDIAIRRLEEEGRKRM